MKLLSYKGVRSGWRAIGSLAVQLRLRSPYSHTEVMFMPGDGVEDLMPDGSLEPVDGAYWCASSSASDPIPETSSKRAGRSGGVRFKRVVPDEAKWDQQDYPFNARQVAQWFNDHQGESYDWKHILSFVGIIFNFLFTQGADKWTCSEACGAAAGFEPADIFDPRNLPVVVDGVNKLLDAE